MAGGLTSLEDAQAAVLALARPAAPLLRPLTEARGWLAAPLVARRTQPRADLSSMDGYALGAGDGPWRVIAELTPDVRDPGAVGANEAARIFTGAPLPAGADRILIQEDAARTADGAVTAAALPPPGQHIRRAGSDFAADDLLMPAGAAVTPALVALAAAAGHGSLACAPFAEVGIIATGSELVPADSDGDGLPSSNSPMLAALVAPLAARVHDGGIVSDHLDATVAAIDAVEAATTRPSLLLVTGGASVGDHDLTRPALEAAGWTIALHRVAMKPGKPLIVAHKAGRVALGLPGNPVSAYVAATLFALPLLRAMAGCPAPLPVHTPARLAAPLAAGGDRVDYRRARRDAGGGVVPATSQDSAGLAALARSDLLIRVDIGAPARAAGDMVQTISLA